MNKKEPENYLFYYQVASNVCIIYSIMSKALRKVYKGNAIIVHFYDIPLLLANPANSHRLEQKISNI